MICDNALERAFRIAARLRLLLADLLRPRTTNLPHRPPCTSDEGAPSA